MTDKERFKQQEKRAKRKSLGLCYRCGQRPYAAGKSYCQICLDKVKVAYIKYNATNSIKRKTWRKSQRQLVFDHYGNICACCGEHRQEFLQIDHINNNGAVHRKEIGVSALPQWLVQNNYPEGFQILCANCNAAKGFYGACPHTKEYTLWSEATA